MTDPHADPHAEPGTSTLPAITPEGVFRECAPRIYHIARRMLGNEADAEDVTQDVLVQVIRKLDTFRGDSAITTWLHRVTVNAALAHRQKRANRRKHEMGEPMHDDLPATGPPPGALRRWEGKSGDPVLEAEQHALIEAAIARLPDPFRDVFVLADVDGLPNSDIADVLGLSLSAVKSRLHRARLRMRDDLAPHFEGGNAS